MRQFFHRLIFCLSLLLFPQIRAAVNSPTTWTQVVLSSNPQTITVPFVFQNAGDLLVLDSKQSPPTVLILNSDYSVTGGNGSTGTIITIVGGQNAVQVGDTITISRSVPLTQTTTFTNSGPLTANMIGNALDKLTMIDQQLNLIAQNSLQFPGDEVLSGLLSKSARAGNLMGFAANGNIQFYSLSSIIFPTVAPIQAATVSALKSIPVSSVSNGYQILVSGYYTAGDGGGGIYVYNSSSSTADNGGSIIAPNAGSGRWLLQYSGQLSVRQFGAYGDNSHDDTAAIQTTLTALAATGGGIAFLPTGAYNITGPVSMTANTTLEGSPVNDAVLVQQTSSAKCVVIDSVFLSKVKDLAINCNGGTGVYINNSTADCMGFDLERLYIFNLPSAGVGIDIAGTSGAHNIGFGTIYDCRVWGDLGTSYGTTVGIRFGVPVGAGEANGITMIGGRVWNLNQGLDLRNCSAIAVYGNSLDDIQGSGGIAVHFEAGAQYSYFFGIRWENGTYTKTVQFDSSSSDNYIYPLQAATTTSLWSDAGVRNQWMGGDSSGGVNNKITSAVDFTGNINPMLGINGITFLNGSGTTPQAIQPTNDSNVPNWNFGGTENGTGPGGSTVTHDFLFPFNALSVPQVYLASCSYVSGADPTNYVTRVSIITETVSGTFAEANLVYVHPGAGTMTFGFTRSSNDVLFAQTTLTGDGGVANSTRNLIRLH